MPETVDSASDARTVNNVMLARGPTQSCARPDPLTRAACSRASTPLIESAGFLSRGAA
jgi:hypothetical protein